jgi:hypothetical protein
VKTLRRNGIGGVQGRGENLQDDPKGGQPKTQSTDADVDIARTLVRSDRRLGARLRAEERNMNREAVRQMIAEDYSYLCLRLYSNFFVSGFPTKIY